MPSAPISASPRSLPTGAPVAGSTKCAVTPSSSCSKCAKRCPVRMEDAPSRARTARARIISKSAAVDRELRPPVAGFQAARLALDPSAVPRVVGQRARLDRRGRERGLHTQRAQFAHGVRQEIDADAEFPQRRRGLVDDGLDTCVTQAERRRQAADSTADDENAHRPPSLCAERRNFARRRHVPSTLSGTARARQALRPEW